MDKSLLAINGTLVITVLALIFTFSDGFRDSSTIVATVVSTRALTSHMAFLLCALAEFSGALFVGSAVAATFGHGLFASVITGAKRDVLMVLISALVAAIGWGAVSWWRAWPTSNNHALFAGLTGASLAAWGPHHFLSPTVFVVLLVLILSPVWGFAVAVGVTRFIHWSGEWMTPHIAPLMERLQVLACLFVSCAHGSNDGQMAMGILVLAFAVLKGWAGIQTDHSLHIPFTVRLAVASAMAGGVMMGGRRILKKLGMKFYQIRSLQGLGAQFTSAATVLACALTGFPASTTQVIASSIMGAGVAKNPRAVRWQVAEDIVLSWILTLPIVALSAFVIFTVGRYFVRGLL
jgi:PiT family inorganic phosphate transporter